MLFLTIAHGMRVLPIPRFHVDSLSVADFDTYFLDDEPVILAGTSVCPDGATLATVAANCSGPLHAEGLWTQGSGWAGMQQSEGDQGGDQGRAQEPMHIQEFVSSMGTTPQKRYAFDLKVREYCHSFLTSIRLPAHFVNVFRSQWEVADRPENHEDRCGNLPMYNLYLAEAGFRTQLHTDFAHTAFAASMCEGRKIS